MTRPQLTRPQMKRTLSTDALIDRIATAPPPAPLRAGRVAVGMAGLVALGVVTGMALFGLSPRAAPLAAMADPVVLAKSVLPLLAAGCAVAAALRGARPGTAPRAWLVWLPALAAAGLVAAAARATPPPGLWPAIAGQSAAACLLTVTALAALPLAMGIAGLRRGASTRPVLSGGMVGLAAGGGAASAYALFCTEDQPLFFVTWYGLAMLLSAAAGAVAGHRHLRW